MNLKPMIGGYEIPRIQRIGTIEDRHLVEISVPGLEGSYHQDLGSRSVSIRIEGTLAGDQARDDFLEAVRDKFNTGEPVDFVADIATATKVERVLIADLKVREVAGSVDSFRYSMLLTQFVEPPQTAPGSDLGFGDLTDLASDLTLEAGDLMDVLEIPDLLTSIPDFGDPRPPLRGTIEQVRTAMTGAPQAATLLGGLFQD